jgi:hypothetical protein
MKNLIALAVLAVLGVTAYLVFREPPVDEEKKKIIDAIKPIPADKVDSISIKRFEGKDKDRKEENYTIAKKGDTWRMVKPVDYAVVESMVDSMKKALGELRIIDVISEKKTSHEKFEVDKKNGVEVTVRSGKETLGHFIIGKARSGVTFARLPGKDTVYRLKGQIKYNFNRAMRLLREKTIVKVKFDDIKRVTFKTDGESLTLEKEGKDKEAKVKPVDVEIKNFDETKAKGVIRSLASLNALDFEDAEVPDDKTGLGEGATEVLLEAQKDDKPYNVTVLVGKEKEGKTQTYCKVSDNKQVFLMSNYTAKRLKSKAEDFSKSDEDVKKEEERKKKAEEKKTEKIGDKDAVVNTAPGGKQLPPDVMKKVQEQMKNQKK